MSKPNKYDNSIIVTQADRRPITRSVKLHTRLELRPYFAAAAY